MAQKIVVILEDDLDGGEAIETLSFTFGGVAYVIDLNDGNATEFKSVMEKYTKAARREGKGKTKTATPASTPVRSGPSPKEVRAWARDAGVEVNERGRIKQHIVDQYLSAK